MSYRAERSEPGRVRRFGWLRFGAVLFTVAAAALLVVVGVDVFIGRPAAGDLFSAGLNALAAVVLWKLVSKQARA